MCVQGQAEHEGHPEPPEVVGAPPSLPNIYTDGAVRPPQRPERATSGIGVWCPSDGPSPVALGEHILDF
eukprot:4241228-Alexandrium_andersonii.AAC.1